MDMFIIRSDHGYLVNPTTLEMVSNRDTPEVAKALACRMVFAYAVEVAEEIHSLGLTTEIIYCHRNED